MGIIERTEQIRAAVNSLVISRGEISEQAGVNPHWLEKFSQNRIKNPTIENVGKLEDFLKKIKALAA